MLRAGERAGGGPQRSQTCERGVWPRAGGHGRKAIPPGEQPEQKEDMRRVRDTAWVSFVRGGKTKSPAAGDAPGFRARTFGRVWGPRGPRDYWSSRLSSHSKDGQRKSPAAYRRLHG